MAEAMRVRLCAVEQFMRNVRTRLPFRYGAATLTHVPILHLRVTVQAAGLRQAEGWSADCLPPGWFDKRPGRTFREDIDSLRYVVDVAIAAYQAAGAGTPFELWHNAYHVVREHGAERGENGLTCGFGSSLVERAVIDAVGKLAGTSVHGTLHANLLGTDLGALHRELQGHEPSQHIAPEPLQTVGVRQTIGGLDPLTDADIGPGEALHDGLPQTLEAYLIERGLRYLKVKLVANLEADLARIRTIAALLERHIEGRYVISIDGNELYTSPAQVAELLEAIRSEPALERFFGAIEYVEQPFSRQVALDPAAVQGLPELNAVKPVVIDESDDGIEAFPTAVELGYQGISIKNCKGVTKAVANHALRQVLNVTRRPAVPYFLTCEDLMNTSVVPVQQDLATAAVLGVPHVERNGHHYVRGLDPLSPRERQGCLTIHDSLYERFGEDNGQLRICSGLIDLRSLWSPGYAVGFAPDWEALTPAERWRFDDLGMDG